MTGSPTAAATRAHVAVVDGPDCGWVLPVPGSVAVVGRATEADLVLADPALSRAHLLVRERNGAVWARPARGRSCQLRASRLRKDGTTALRRRRRVRRRWRRLGPGSLIQIGTSTLQVRRHPGLDDERTTTATDHGDGIGIRMLLPLAMVAGMLPLALTANSGWRAAIWIVMPVAVLVSVAWPWWRQRRRRTREAAEQRRREAETDRPQPTAPPDPAGLLLRAERPWPQRRPAWDVGTVVPGEEPQTVEPPGGGAGVALVGPPAAVTAMARWLLCQASWGTPPHEGPLRLPAGQLWAWAHALPHVHTGTRPRLVVLDARVQHSRRIRALPDAGALVLATSWGQVPAWCERVVEVGERHDRRVSEAWAAEVAAHLQTASAGGLPRRVTLAELTGPLTAAAVRARWQAEGTGLTTTLGVDADGPVRLNLADDGPHALVAGTTGSGKSELLTTWVLGLAIEHSPERLGVLLVDYKGGATFGTLTALPHAVGLLTDLDPSASARALASLQAELERRERVLAQAGARSLTELVERGGALPRLLIVVDEFRAMSQTHPDLLESLVRLAAQGRSLGIHLVLATQRPAGAITADMRANLPVRLCLRVLEQTDSVDVIGDGAGAALPAVPGRALLRTERRTEVQIAWPGRPEHEVADVVRAIATASAGLARARAPWAPPLPELVTLTALDEAQAESELDADPPTAVPSGGTPPLLILRTDLPREQRLGTWALREGTTLLVSGPPGSGRSTAAAAAVHQALRHGVPTHVIATSIPTTPSPALGTVCTPQEVRRAAALLRTLAAGGDPALLVVDDAEELIQAVDASLGFGTGVELLSAVLTSARRHRLTVAVTLGVSTNRWAAQVSTHLVLNRRDRGEALMAGVPRELVSLDLVRGRGILLDADPRSVQVAVPDGAPPPTPARTPPLRILPLPGLVDLALDAAAPDVLLGIGGNAAQPVLAPLHDGDTWLVLGGPGTGRSRTLATISARLAAAGRPVVGLGPEGLASGPGSRSAVLVIDDVDRLAAAGVTAATHWLAGGGAVLAAGRPEPLTTAYHELARRLREPDLLLVLGPVTGVGPWAGADLRAHSEPGPVGRGVMVRRGTALALQVDRCSAAHRTAEPSSPARPVAAMEEGSSSPIPTTREAPRVG